MGCQKKITHTIIEEKANYVIQVKENQQRLYEDIDLFFQDDANGCCGSFDTIDGDHGRIENRQYLTIGDIDWLSGKNHGPENFAILRHMAINLLKRETSLKVGYPDQAA